MKGPKVLLDCSIHLARYRDMDPPDGRVSVEPFSDVGTADPEDIRRWHAEGRVQSIRLHGNAIGLIAVAPGRIGWIDADEIDEEVIDAAYAGHGNAPDAVRAGRPRVLDDAFLALD